MCTYPLLFCHVNFEFCCNTCLNFITVLIIVMHRPISWHARHFNYRFLIKMNVHTNLIKSLNNAVYDFYDAVTSHFIRVLNFLITWPLLFNDRNYLHPRMYLFFFRRSLFRITNVLQTLCFCLHTPRLMKHWKWGKETLLKYSFSACLKLYVEWNVRTWKYRIHVWTRPDKESAVRSLTLRKETSTCRLIDSTSCDVRKMIL